MKKLFILLLLLLAVFSLSAKKKTVIENPFYEFRHSGIYTIQKLELTDTETRLYVHITFLPGWWVKFTQSMFIQPEGKDKIHVTGIEKGEFDKEIYLRGSGDSTFILRFPPLDKTVTTFDFGDFNELFISGISLEKNTEKRSREKRQKQLEKEKEAIDWIEREIINSGEALKEYESPEFFKSDTARFIGYIKGYSPKLEKSTGIIYASNELTKVDYPIVINIYPDGRFEANIPLKYPAMPFLALFNVPLPMYFEPGCTLGAIYDWEEFLEANRYRDRRWEIKNFSFYGPLARINSELLSTKLATYDWKNFENDTKNLTPGEFKAKVKDIYEESRSTIQEKAGELSEKGLKVLTNTASVDYGYTLMDFVSMRSYFASEDTSAILQLPLPDDFYDFLQELSLDKQILLASPNSDSFINRLEYSKILLNAITEEMPSIPKKRFFEYLLEEEGIILTEEEKILEDFYKNLPNGAVVSEEEGTQGNSFMEDKMDIFKAFYEKYDSLRPRYNEKYLAVIQQTDAMSKATRTLYEWHLTDSVWQNKLYLKPGLISQTIKLRELPFFFETWGKEEGENLMKNIETYIKHPFLKNEAFRLFNEAFPEDETGIYELPDTPSADMFRKIIEPFRGKYILVDFWDIFCGPCIGGIKRMKEQRKKLKDSPDIAFVFIASTSGSPADRYETFIGEQELEHTIRLSDDDYNRMRELFKFNGIPHYRTVNREGKVLQKSITAYNFNSGYEQLLHLEKSRQNQ